MTEDHLNLADLKAKSPKDLLAMAEELEIENASTMRKGEIMFASQEAPLKPDIGDTVLAYIPKPPEQKAEKAKEKAKAKENAEKAKADAPPADGGPAKA